MEASRWCACPSVQVSTVSLTSISAKPKIPPEVGVGFNERLEYSGFHSNEYGRAVAHDRELQTLKQTFEPGVV